MNPTSVLNSSHATGLVVSALGKAFAVPCIRNGVVLAGSAHTMRHLAGPGWALMSIATEAAALHAAGSCPVASIVIGGGLYFLPKAIERFAQEAFSRAAFFALDAGWSAASTVTGLAALGVSKACTGVYRSLYPNPSSEQNIAASASSTTQAQALTQQDFQALLQVMMQAQHAQVTKYEKTQAELLERIDGLTKELQNMQDARQSTAPQPANGPKRAARGRSSTRSSVSDAQAVSNKTSFRKRIAAIKPKEHQILRA